MASMRDLRIKRRGCRQEMQRTRADRGGGAGRGWCRGRPNASGRRSTVERMWCGPTVVAGRMIAAMPRGRETWMIPRGATERTKIDGRRRSRGGGPKQNSVERARLSNFRRDSSRSGLRARKFGRRFPARPRGHGRLGPERFEGRRRRGPRRRHPALHGAPVRNVGHARHQSDVRDLERIKRPGGAAKIPREALSGGGATVARAATESFGAAAASSSTRRAVSDFRRRAGPDSAARRT